MQNALLLNSIIFHNDHVLLTQDTIFWEDDLSSIGELIVKETYFDGVRLVEFSSFDLNQNILKNGRWILVKEALRVAQEQDLAFLLKAFAIIKWDRHYQFCGKCAKETSLITAGFERRCDVCALSYYPRISPAIIVLIHRENEILMARSPHFAPGIYALIAGFVEPGETLEAAVHREVFEEVGIRIKDLSYYGSQPWPFPDSLMIGFTAAYDSGEISIHPDEIEEAGWYRLDNLPGLPSFSMSIAFEMIHQFIRKHDESV